MRVCPVCAMSHANADWQCPACGFLPPSANGFPALAPELAVAGEGFDPGSYEQLAALEAGNFWFRARNRLIVSALKRHFPRAGRYLEIGCGTGYVLSGVAAACPGLELTGSELFSTGLGFASRRVPGAELLQMDARRLPYESHFDVIGAFDVLEHISNDQEVLVQMYKALCPGGGILLTVPQHPSLWSPQDEHACHVRRYRMGELREKVSNAGFKVEYATSFVTLLLPAMYVSRLVYRNSGKPCDPMAELRLPRVVNQLFGIVMRLEGFLLDMGLRFPIGGSQLLVARKVGG